MVQPIAKHPHPDLPRPLGIVEDVEPDAPVEQEALAPLPAPPPSPPVRATRPHQRKQLAPYVDLYQPTWLEPLIRTLILDEHGPMPRTVQAQVGFGALLMGVQFCLDMLAWILGFRWVFVNAMGPGGWVLAVLFALLISSIIAIFERFVLTADVYGRKLPLFLNPAILMRVAVVVLFASVTAIPVEMLVFNDVIQGRLNGELQGVREGARQQLRTDFKQDMEGIAGEEGAARKRVKDETPPVPLESLATPEMDERIKALQEQLNRTAIDLREEDAGWRSGKKGKGRQYLRLQDEKSQLEQAVLDAKAARQTEIDKRADNNRKATAASAEMHFKELSRISDRYDPHKRDLEKKLRRVDTMSDDELKRATRREFAVVDGFARRWKIMNDLEKEDPIFGVTKWAVRVLFVAFGLLVLTTKALFNRPTKAYFAGRDPLNPDAEEP